MEEIQWINSFWEIKTIRIYEINLKINKKLN